MSIRDILDKYGITMAELSRRYRIPYRTIQDWAAGVRKAPEYVLELIDKCLQYENETH